MKVSDILNEATAGDYEAIATKDFQGRNGRNPMPELPDTIKVDAYTHGADMIFSFHNTRQSAAENWVGNFLSSKNLPYDSITSMQSGDYEDDWVEVTASVHFL
jgi:hypothetical protein